MQLMQQLLKKVDKESRGAVCVDSFMCLQHLCISFECVSAGLPRRACVRARFSAHHSRQAAPIAAS